MSLDPLHTPHSTSTAASVLETKQNNSTGSDSTHLDLIQKKTNAAALDRLKVETQNSNQNNSIDKPLSADENANLFQALASHYQSQGNYNRSMSVAEKGLRANPTNNNTIAGLQLNIALTHQKNRRYELIILAATEGLKASPSDKTICAKLYLSLAYAYYHLKMVSKAIETAKAGLELDPIDNHVRADLNLALARYCTISGEFEQGLNAAENSLKANPISNRVKTTAHLNIATLFLKIRQFDQVIHHAQISLGSAPNEEQAKILKKLIQSAEQAQRETTGMKRIMPPEFSQLPAEENKEPLQKKPRKE